MFKNNEKGIEIVAKNQATTLNSLVVAVF